MSEIYRNPAASVEERVEDLLGRMTREEKIGQLSQFFKLFYRGDQAAMDRDIAAGRHGSRILADSAVTGNAGANLAIDDLNRCQRVAVEQSRLGIPLIFGRDVIYGEHTIFPIPLGQSCSWNPELVEASYTCIAREAAAAGVHWSFAPMMDIARDPRWGRIIEGGGEDPLLTSALAVAAVKGFQGEDPAHPERILACAKHYVAYGTAEGGRDYDRGQLGENELHNIYLPPFKAVCEAGIASVMSGFQQIDNVPVSGSRYALTEILKVEWNWDGFVVSDWGSVEQLEWHGFADDGKEAAARAFDAGVDMEMVSNLYRDHLGGLIDEGVIPAERLDDAVRRVLRAKFRCGLFERPYADAATFAAVAGREDHRATALELALQCPVLVRNRDAVLPLRPDAKIAVIGPFAEERRAHVGSWCPNPAAVAETSILDGIRLIAPQAKIIHHPSALNDASLVLAGRGADVIVVCVGEHDISNGEASNIAALRLPAGQEELIEAAARHPLPLVVVNCAGRPLPMPAAERHAAAILYAWNLGSRAGEAIARLLFGLDEPSGRLTVSIAANEGQVPVYYNRHLIGKAGDRQGYQPYLDQYFAPLHPFGFGLGYTSWAYEDLTLDREEIAVDGSLSASITVRNTGARRGSTVVQCYVRDVAGSTCRPQRELKGFRRLSLEAGASERVTFTIGPQELAFYGATREWRVEPGRFDLGIGGDSRCELAARFRVL